MTVLPRLIRYTRKAALQVGLIDRGYAALAAGVGALIDRRAPELMAAHRVPGLSVRVSLADASVVERTFGVADASTDAPVTPDTLFQVMSIAKPVAAFGALRLAERGVLDLDAPISRRLRSWTMPVERRHGHDFEQVTLRRLLSHTAGLNIAGFGWAPPGAPAPTPAQLLEGFEGAESVLRLIHAPGERLDYSGGGYTLVQLAIEDATGRPFAEVMRDEVFEPLGMSSTSYAQHAHDRSLLAARHDAEARPLPRAEVSAQASTGLHSTPHDLAVLWGAMFQGPGGEPPGRGVLSQSAARLMTTPLTDPRGERVCGLGFFLWLKRTDTVFSHSGFKQGCWSQVDGLLKRRAVIAVCSNSDAGKPCVTQLCAEVRQLLFDRAI